MKLRGLLLFILFLLSASVCFADTITLTDFADKTVAQRSGTTGSLTISGTYSGTPTHIEYDVVQYGTTTEVVAWATLVNSPSAGTFSATATGIPQGYGPLWYSVRVRYSNDHAVISTGTHKVGVGIIASVIGQSNARYGWWDTSYPDGGDSAAGLSDYVGVYAYTASGTVYTTPTVWGMGVIAGNAAVAYANHLVSSQNVPVGMLLMAIPGAAMTSDCQFGYSTCPGGQCGYWLYNGGIATYDWTPYATAIAAVGGTESVVWIQGETEADLNCATGTYQANLTSFLAQLRTLCGSNVKIVVSGLNSWARTGNTAVRTAQSAACSADTGSPKAIYVDMTDIDTATVQEHYTATENVTVGGRLANAFYTITPTAQFFGGHVGLH
jgi:hypothetical protein